MTLPGGKAESRKQKAEAGRAGGIHGTEPWCPKAEIRNRAKAAALRLGDRRGVEVGAELLPVVEATLFAMSTDMEKNCVIRKAVSWKWLIRRGL